MRPAREEREEPNKHPGWAVQFSDGSWLGGAHGWFRSDDAAYADIYDSEEEARSSLGYVRRDDREYFALDAKVIPAWEPLCESLRYEIKRTRDASKITSDDVYRLVSSLEDVINTINYDVLSVLEPSNKKK